MSFGVAAVVRPGRNEGREAVEPGRIRVGIGADFDAGPAGLVDMRDDLRHAPPVLTARGLEMPDFDRDVSFAADADGFVERGNDGIAFAAHMRGVDAAELCAFGGESDQFLGGGIGRGRILQRSGDADRAVAHGVAHQRFHPLEFGGGGRAIAIADHRPAHLGGADVARQVDAHALLFEAREKLAESVPRRGRFCSVRSWRGPPCEWRR